MQEVSDIQLPDLGDPNIKILTYGLIKQINENSLRADRNRTVYFEQLPIEDDGTIYPVVMSFIHNEVEMRTMILLNGEGLAIGLDMSMNEFEALPTYGQLEEIIATQGRDTQEIREQRLKVINEAQGDLDASGN